MEAFANESRTRIAEFSAPQNLANLAWCACLHDSRRESGCQVADFYVKEHLPGGDIMFARKVYKRSYENCAPATHRAYGKLAHFDAELMSAIADQAVLIAEVHMLPTTMAPVMIQVNNQPPNFNLSCIDAPDFLLPQAMHLQHLCNIVMR